MTARRSARGIAGLAGLGAAAAGLRRVAAADRAAVAADPHAAELAPLPPGEELTAVSADGTRLHVEVRGPAGAPAIVFAHGWTCAAAFWTPQVRALQGEFRVIAYDQRGHGRSDIPAKDGFTTDALAEDLQAVLTATVPAGEKAVLVGHSMGAMTIVAWAGRFPAEVERRAAAAVLASTGVEDLVQEALLLPYPARWASARAAVTGALLRAPAPMGPASPISFRLIRYIALSRQASPAQVAFSEQLTLAAPVRGRHGWAVTLGTIALRPALAHLTVPTVVVVGTADRLTPPRHAEQMAAELPKLDELVELPGTGHMTPIEQAGAVTAEIRRLASAYLPAPGPAPAVAARS